MRQSMVGDRVAVVSIGKVEEGGGGGERKKKNSEDCACLPVTTLDPLGRRVAADAAFPLFSRSQSETPNLQRFPTVLAVPAK